MRCAMKILVNGKIKRLFLCVVSVDIGFLAVVLLCMSLKVKNALVYVMIAAICMMAAVLGFLYLYFREQNKIMEDAISRIRDYIPGTGMCGLTVMKRESFTGCSMRSILWPGS